MSNLPEILISLAIRGLVASPFILISVSGRAGFYTPAFGLLAAVILASPVARLLAEPWGDLIYPVRRSSKPGPVYSIPQSRRAKGEYEEAIAGFEKISEEFPDEVKPYIEMIDIAILDLKDPGRANDIFQTGVALLKTEKDREILAKLYSAIRTRLNAKPSN